MSHSDLRARHACLGLILLLCGCQRNTAAPAPTPPSPAAASQPGSSVPRFALLVGVNEYAIPKDLTRAVLPLAAPGNDVLLIKDLLVRQYGFPDDPVHMKTLIGRQATREAVTQSFAQQLIESAKKAKDQGQEATVVFFYSGHGSTTRDLDGDEGDGVDETLVAYDSRIENGRDIVDDEVRAWLDELRKYTSNITFIFDSCHSGSAARDVGIARLLPPNPNMPAPPPPSERPGSRDIASGFVPRGTQYALLSGSRADELSHEDDFQTPAGRKPYGFFTYHLVNALKQNPDLTYLQAVRTAEVGVTKLSPSQHPQAEGDVNRRAFGGIGDQDDPYIRITARKSATVFTIDAGAMVGMRPGAMLALYSPKARKLVGEEQRIANAIVKSVLPGASEIELLDQPREPVTETTKARLVASLDTFPVFVDALVGQDTSAQDRAMLAKLAALLARNKLVNTVKVKDAWRLGIKRGCADSPGAGCAESYYLVSRDTDFPVTDARPVVAQPDAAAAKLADALRLLATQENVRGIENPVSSLNGKVEVSLIALTVADEGGASHITGEKEMPAASIIPMHVGENFKIRVTNRSGKDLSIAVIALGSSGSVHVSPYTPSPTGERVKHGNPWETEAFTFGEPFGLETYKVIATTIPDVNFTVIDQPGVTKGPNDSPLTWLLNQTANTKTRDATPLGQLTADSWTTARVDVLVQPPN